MLTWKGKTEELSGGEQDTTNLRMELTAACVALETIDEGHTVTIYSDASYLVNCMRRGWYKKWRENGWLNHRKEPVANFLFFYRTRWPLARPPRISSVCPSLSISLSLDRFTSLGVIVGALRGPERVPPSPHRFTPDHQGGLLG